MGDFTGVVKPQVTHDSSRYLLEVFHDPDLGVRLDIDAQTYGNETRYINSYQGIAPAPNVAFCVYRAPNTGEIAVGVIATAAIKYGEELLVDYGSKFWRSSSGEQGGAHGMPWRPR